MTVLYRLFIGCFVLFLNINTNGQECFEDIVSKATDRMFTQDRLNLKIDVKAYEGNSQVILEESQIVLQKKGSSFYKKMFDQESFYSTGEGLLLVVDHSLKYLNLSRLNSSKTDVMLSLLSVINTSFLDIKSTYINDHWNYTLSIGDKLVAEYKIDKEYRIKSTIQYIDNDSNVKDDKMRVEMLFTYLKEEPNFSKNEFIRWSNSKWEAKQKYKEYRWLDRTLTR